MGLTLNHVLAGMGAEPESPGFGWKIFTSSATPSSPLTRTRFVGPEDLTDERVLAYTREQDVSHSALPRFSSRLWVILIADGKNRSRLWGTFENYVRELQRLNVPRICRYFDLHTTEFLAPLKDRLVIEWDTPRSWHRGAKSASASRMPVVEIADRDKVPFPGFDGVLLTYHELQYVLDDPRYRDWRAALSEVQGIYLITDSSNGRSSMLARPTGRNASLAGGRTYARDGHGGNVALRELAYDSAGATDAGLLGVHRTDHARHFVFSLLRVFGPSTPSSEVNAAESHYKAALMTRKFGLNQNTADVTPKPEA